MPRTLAIGDIHGCFDAMMAMIDWVAPTPDDQLIFLGDYVNRGPNSDKVLSWLNKSQSQLNLICLRGNHEIMMMEERSGKLSSTVRRFVDELEPYHETASHIFVHACVDGDIPMDVQPDYYLYWERFESMTQPACGKKVICGHTVQKSGKPLQNDFAVCIDTNCCRGGWLTCLDVDSGRYFQTNQDLDRRKGALVNWTESAKTASRPQ
jgi:serine/threonine protein phosphatase 1